MIKIYQNDIHSTYRDSWMDQSMRLGVFVFLGELLNDRLGVIYMCGRLLYLSKEV